uniref:Uncharacterized protein n=1 Tax=Anguilla anguilla TaxID=7936 RepID=A0A0E9WPT2_ANGAN
MHWQVRHIKHVESIKIVEGEVNKKQARSFFWAERPIDNHLDFIYKTVLLCLPCFFTSFV